MSNKFLLPGLVVIAVGLVVAGGLVIKNMGKGGNIPEDAKKSSADKNYISEEKIDADDESNSEMVSKEDSGKTAAENLMPEHSSEEEPNAEQTVPWQTYGNDFYTLEYPADYEISEKNKTTGDIDFRIGGQDGEAVSFISGGKKTLAFQGAWSVIAENQATDQKLLDTENIDANGVRFKKNYWAIRQIDDGNWLAAIVYYGCDQNQHCFSMLRGMTAKGIPAWEEKTGSQLSDKVKIKTLVSLIKTSKEPDTISFNNIFLTFRFSEKDTVSPASAGGTSVPAASGATKWKDCVFNPIITASPDSTDRKLVCYSGDGAQKVIAESVKTVMNWGALAEFYPNKVLFTPYSKEIYLTKYLSDSDSSSGIFALDVTTLESRRLANVGEIYENYYNYISIISPDKKLIAALGYSDLYILDFAADKATVVAAAAAGEIFNPAGGTSDFKWLDNSTVQYPVYKNNDFAKPAEIRKAAVK